MENEILENEEITLEECIQKSLDEVYSCTPDCPEAYRLAVENLARLQELKAAQEKEESERIDRRKQRRLGWAGVIVNCVTFLGGVGLTIWRMCATDFWKRTALLYEENGTFTPATKDIMREKFPEKYQF